jgi:hypothetical protein
MSDSEEFKLKYSTAKKEEVTRQITTTLEELEQAYNSTMASWETIKNVVAWKPLPTPYVESEE